MVSIEDYPQNEQSYADLMEIIWNENTGTNFEVDFEVFPVSRL